VLAEKTPSGAVPSVHHRQLILAELLGQTVEMTGQALIGAGDVKQAPDGTVGVHVDEFPEEAALLRWKNHDSSRSSELQLGPGARSWPSTTQIASSACAEEHPPERRQ